MNRFSFHFRFLPILLLLSLPGSTSLIAQEEPALPEANAQKKSLRIVSLYAQGEGTASADSALVHLQHRAEATKLVDAINGGTAAKKAILDKLTQTGIPKDAIEFQNFTSDSQTGKLTGRVKSYTVTSPITVKVTDETQFATVAVVVDADPDLEYLRRESLVTDKSAAQMKAAENAVENLKRKAALYEKSFGLKVELYSFSEVSQREMAEGGGRNRVFAVAGKPLYGDSIDGLIAEASRSSATPAMTAGMMGDSFSKVRSAVYLLGLYRIVEP